MYTHRHLGEQHHTARSTGAPHLMERDPVGRRGVEVIDSIRRLDAGTILTTILVVGATPGEAYVPPPEEAGEAFAAYGKGDYETAVAKQLIVVEKRPDDPVASFNAACFQARAGRASRPRGAFAE